MEKVTYIGTGFGSLKKGTEYNLIKEYDNDYLVFDEYGNEAAIPKKDFADRITEEKMKDFRTEAKQIEKEYNELAKNQVHELYLTNYGGDAKKRAEGYMSLKAGYKPKQDSHYDNSNGSLYLFAEQHKLNAWEFDIIKRVVRCRQKGQFKEDLEKTVRVLELYAKEYNIKDLE
jgi:hypothetical protein